MGDIKGVPNVLSSSHHAWPEIGKVSEASVCDGKEERGSSVELTDMPPRDWPDRSVAKTVRQRRSAVAFDGKTSITRDTFFQMLEATLPRPARPPFSLDVGEPRVHLLLFVHRVEGLPSGLYAFLRRPFELEELQSKTRSEFLWRPEEEGLPLYALIEGDFRHEAATFSCQQSIAGDSAFSLGMLARFHDVIEASPHLYRQLFWETGMIGQVLYLMAEAQGVRGTGIGCFFDDGVHDLLGLKDKTWQSLYHFTVGGPVEDSRLQTFEAYFHVHTS